MENSIKTAARRVLQSAQGDPSQALQRKISRLLLLHNHTSRVVVISTLPEYKARSRGFNASTLISSGRSVTGEFVRTVESRCSANRFVRLRVLIVAVHSL